MVLVSETAYKPLAFETWQEHLKDSWYPGDHLAIVGPTGKGKTYLAHEVLAARRYVLALITKKRDQTIDKYEDYRAIKDIKNVRYDDTRLLLWKKPDELGVWDDQRDVIYRGLSHVYKTGHWAVYFDDLSYVANTLRMKEAIKMMYTQVRSDGITLVGSIQRPAWVPWEVLTQSTHLIVFQTNGDHDIPAIAEAASVPLKQLKAMNAQLKDRQFIYVKHGEGATLVEKAS